MNQFNHKTQLQSIDQLKHVLRDGDISLTVFLSGLGLFLMAILGLTTKSAEMVAYANMFPIGNVYFWIANYFVCGFMMWFIVAKQFPPTTSLLLGSWCLIIWSWSLLGRMSDINNYQTGNVTSVIYVIIGFLIIQRSQRYYR